jgi:hypothetical protein
MGTLSLLADAASPVALPAIGAVLARAQINSALRMPYGRYVPVALINSSVTRCWSVALGWARWQSVWRCCR